MVTAERGVRREHYRALLQYLAPYRLGLTGIKERVKDINGSATIETRPGGGTVVHITLPVPATEHSKEDVVANSAR